MALAGTFVLAAAVVGLWWARSRDALQPSNFRLLSTFPGAHRSATLSPDGSRLAFLDVGQGIPQVWVRNLGEGDPIQVTSGDRTAVRPRWSPAGDRIVFGRRGAGIWEVSSLGGSERRLIAEGANPHLSAGGKLMVFERGSEIWIASADGSGEHRVEGVPQRAYTVDLAPAISPDGSLIAFFVSELGPNGDLWVIPSTGGEARRLTHDVTEGGTPDWTPDGQRIVFSSARGGSHTLWSISPDGGAPEPVTTGAGEDRDPVISSDGGTLLYTNVRNSWSLMMADANGGERRLTESRSGILWPMFSPDGSLIAYFGPDGGGSTHVFTVTLDGKVRQVTRTLGDATEINTMPRWGADSDHLYYYQQRPENSFRRIPLLGGPSVQVAPWTWEVHFGAAVHPRDGRVAYVHRGRSPPVSLVLDPATGAEVEIPQVLFDLSWSADGQSLLGAWQNRIYRCDAATWQRCTPITTGSRPCFPADGARLFFVRPGPSPLHREIWVRDMASGAERPLRTIGPLRAIDIHFHVSSRGDLVWAPIQEGRHELWMAELQ
jgi:Tol biopolymer transport system component